MKYLILLSFIFSCNYGLFAQAIDEDAMIDQDVPGYIIMSRGDTILGKIKVSTRSKNQVRVKFTPQSKFKSSTYKAKDKALLGYGYQTIENSGSPQKVYKYRHFTTKQADQPPLPFSSSTVFMEVKAMGSVSLFSYYVESNTQVESTYVHYYFMESKYENTEEIRKRKVLRSDFETRTASFTEDCPTIQNLIGSSFDYSNLDRIVIAYNNCQKIKIGGSECDECREEMLEKQRKAEELRKQRELELEQKFKSSNSN